MKECINICYCINIKPNYKKNNIIKYEENLDCKNGYANIPKIKIKNTSLKPNIILFVLDDLDEIISPYFDAMPFARELFKINGTHFRNGFTSTSFCSPSRSQILTGLYGHNNGNIGMVGKHGGNSAFRNPYHLNGTKMKDGEKCINNEDRTLAIFLQKYAGYHTSIIGKYLNGIENIKTRKIDYIPIGWNDFHIGSDPFMYLGYGYTLTNYSSSNKILTYEYYGFNEEDYITDVISKKTINIIDKNNNKPLFMYIAPSAPHFPLPCAERHKHLLTFWNDQYDGIGTYYHNSGDVFKGSWKDGINILLLII
jgi:arylsulfatase A-like enzyme